MGVRKSDRKVRGKSSLLSRTKVLRIIRSLGWDPEKFESAYKGDSSRGPRARSFSPREASAIEGYLKRGHSRESFKVLMSALGTKNPTTAINAVFKFQDTRQA